MISERSSSQLDVKQAVRKAIDFVREVYAEETISDLGLEEVRLDDGVWLITLGFSRPWNVPRARRSMYELLPSTTSAEASPERDYKVVRIDAETGAVLGMGIREG